MIPEDSRPVTDWRGADDVLTYDTWTQIRSLHRQGQSIRQIARGLDIARNTVREALRSSSPPQYGPRAPRSSLVDPYRGYLTERAPQVGYNAWRLYLELQQRGYPGKYEMVLILVEKGPTFSLKKDPPPRAVHPTIRAIPRRPLAALCGSTRLSAPCIAENQARQCPSERFRRCGKHLCPPLFRRTLILGPIARPVDRDDMAVMQEPIQHRAGDHVVATEDGAPLLEGLIAGEDDRAVLIESTDELKEEIGTTCIHGKIAQFIEDQKLQAAKGG